METCSWLWPLGKKDDSDSLGRSPATPSKSSLSANHAKGLSTPPAEHGSGCSCRLCLDALSTNYCTGSKVAASPGLEIRMPELSSPCSSPGARQDNESTSASSHSSSLSVLCGPSPPRLPRGRSRKRTTAAEAYNKGMLLQYVIENVSSLDCCGYNHNTAVSDYSDFESNWEGHQPLTSATWDTSPEEDDATLTSILSASEQRMMRSRRRRGVMSPPRSIGNGSRSSYSKISPMKATMGQDGDFFVAKAQSQQPKTPEPKLPGYGIAFPGDVEDPHLRAKKKWQPKCGRAFSGESDSD